MRAVVFDMDGLMFDSESIYTMVGTELLGRRGLDFTTELKSKMMGLPPKTTFQTMIDHHGMSETWLELAAESDSIFVSLLDEHLVEMSGLWELLDALEKANIPKAIATSSNSRLTGKMLSRYDLQPRFKFILTAEDITHGKPHPEIYLTAAARFGLPPAEVLVLEDSHNGCMAAIAAGAFTVAVPGEHSRGHDFSAAALVLDGLDDPRLYEVLGIDR
jgi:HAD superfamily hydrolase (TIGR01509 family)